MAKATEPAIKIPFKTLVGLLGKTPKDEAVLAMIAKAGKVTVKSDYIIAKDAGFDVSLDRPDTAKGNAKKVLSTLFLYADGNDKHRGYPDLPKGFTFGTRAELFAAVGEPVTTWKMGKGKVPAETKDPDWDMWRVDGVEIVASYSSQTGMVGNFNVTLPDEATGGQDFSTYPLHFETKPVDAPEHADLVGMGLLVAWAAERCGLPAKHAGSKPGKQLLARAITPRAFLVAACESTLTSLDFDPKLHDFLYAYEHNIGGDEGERDKADAKIAKLLRYDDKERRCFNDDFLGTFADAVENPFHVPDSWAAVDRIAPVLDARRADYAATGFNAEPDVASYEKAAKQRDKVAITADRAALAGGTVTTADAKLADDLVALIGRSLKEPDVRAVLTRAGMPIGKTIDQQANPALGVAYMGSKFKIGDKRLLGVDAVWFFAAKQKSYIRGIGAEVEFAKYPGPLPKQLELGEARAAVAKKLGKPKSTYEDCD